MRRLCPLVLNKEAEDSILLEAFADDTSLAMVEVTLDLLLVTMVEKMIKTYRHRAWWYTGCQDREQA